MSVDSLKIASSQSNGGRIDDLISKKASFQVTDVVNIGAVVSQIEKTIESKSMSCRVYTEYRMAAIVGTIWNPFLGIAAAAGLAVHNLATINPDYEIAKNKVASTVTVTYKK